MFLSSDPNRRAGPGFDLWAWLDTAGRFVSSTDMEPCLDKPDCPTYSAAAPYRYALEVPKGGLGALSIGDGSVISVGGPCA